MNESMKFRNRLNDGKGERKLYSVRESFFSEETGSVSDALVK